MLALHYRVAKIRSKCIDDDISAEIPNQSEEMELHVLVLKHMMTTKQQFLELHIVNYIITLMN